MYHKLLFVLLVLQNSYWPWAALPAMNYRTGVPAMEGTVHESEEGCFVVVVLLVL